MAFFDFFSERASSAADNWEKIMKAREYNSRAREIVDNAMSKYNSRYFKVVEHASKTERELKKHNDFKKEIARKLNLGIEATLNNFKTFNIDSKINTPNIDIKMDLPVSNIGEIGFNLSRFCMDDSFARMRSLFSDATDEYYEAKSNLNQAKLYKNEVSVKISELDMIRSNLDNIRYYIDGERRVLTELLYKIEKISKLLEEGMKKTSFTNEEGELLKGQYKIALRIKSLISTKFLDDDFSIAKDYDKIYRELEQINSMLDAPNLTINSLNTILKKIPEIIVY